jgi:acetyltransferase-like isoleucine patch superfamily enzyme
MRNVTNSGEPGGEAVPANQVETLADALAPWASEGRGYYTDGYRPPNGPSGDTGSVPAPVQDASVPDCLTGESSRQLFQEFLGLHQQLRGYYRNQFARSLPLGEELTNRWERAQFLGFGQGASIYDSALVFGDVKVGAGTWIGPNCILDGSGGLQVGSTCSVASGCQIYSHDTVDWALSGGQRPYQRRPTSIGNACYLGPQAIITAGVRIGNHCLIGALSLVKRDLPDFSIAVGIPAKVVGRVDVGPNGEIQLHYDKPRNREAD